MKRICIPLANGFEEIEAVTLIDVLRRAGFSVITCGLTGLQVCGAHNVTVAADIMISEALKDRWDLVVLPGGMPGATNLREDARVGKLLEQTVQADGYVGAICAAPIVLAHFGFVKGKKATSYPGFGNQMPEATYCEDRVVCDGKVLTSRGPGTAMEFALAITELLAGCIKADEIRKQMLIK
ncbi:MAG: DJ-1/PfpI family protein [Acidobacteria bacterium]|nr:DJ-1/PfpI family protein [Acidobacteriota bacterium]